MPVFENHHLAVNNIHPLKFQRLLNAPCAGTVLAEVWFTVV